MIVFFWVLISIFVFFISELGVVFTLKKLNIKIREFEIGVKISERFSYSFKPIKNSEFKISINPILLYCNIKILDEDIKEISREDKINILYSGIKTSILSGLFVLWVSGLGYIVFIENTSASLVHFLTMTCGYIAIWVIVTSDSELVGSFVNLISASFIVIVLGTMFFGGFFEITEYIVFGNSAVQYNMFFTLAQIFGISSILWAGTRSVEFLFIDLKKVYFFSRSNF